MLNSKPLELNFQSAHSLHNGQKTFLNKLDSIISEYSLLKHPFYQLWNTGALSRETLQDYAVQYYHHVKAFPRYVSAVHSMCEDIQSRKMLLENLNDEESNDTDHPTLWRNFAIGIGNDEDDLNTKPDTSISDLINKFFHYCRSSYHEGLASFYTYESQIPEIAATKMNGLKKFYNITNAKTLKFFDVHQKADVWHREQCKQLLSKITDRNEQQYAVEAAESIALQLWGFLSAMLKKHNIKCTMA